MVAFALMAPVALAGPHDGGEGLYGETNDKVVTYTGFILIVGIPILVLILTLIQSRWSGARTVGSRRRRRARRAPTCAAAGSRIFTPPGAGPRRGRSGPGAPRPGPLRLTARMVQYERTGAAAVVTIDRAERRNAVDGPTAAALLEAYERFAADDDARVLVLTGAGDQAFCAGADLKALETLDPDAPAGPMGFSRLTPAKPDDRGDRRLVRRRRARTRALVRPARSPTRRRSSAASSGAGASR